MRASTNERCKMELIKKIGKIILTICIALLSILLSFALLLILTDIFLIEDDFLFYEHRQITGEILLALVLIPSVFLGLFITQKLNVATRRQLERNEKSLYIWNRLGFFKIPIIIIWAVALYYCFTSVTVVTETEIIIKTPFNPSGNVYKYEDVDSIETGFGNKVISCSEYNEKGNFYYKIIIDGKEIVFSQPTVNDKIERYNKNTYLELEEFDHKLVSLGVFKTSSDKGFENSYFEDDIIKRFLKIINNKQ